VTGQVDNRHHEGRRPARTGTGERRLVHPQPADTVQSGFLGDQWPAVLAHRVDRRPAAAGLGRDLGHGVTVLPRPPAHLGAGSFRQ
jgi:hypothetical protein